MEGGLCDSMVLFLVSFHYRPRRIGQDGEWEFWESLSGGCWLWWRHRIWFDFAIVVRRGAICLMVPTQSYYIWP